MIACVVCAVVDAVCGWCGVWVVLVWVVIAVTACVLFSDFAILVMDQARWRWCSGGGTVWCSGGGGWVSFAWWCYGAVEVDEQWFF